MAENEDLDYIHTPDFATPEDEKQPDEDQPYKGVLVEVKKYLNDSIVEHNSFDVIDLTESAKMTPTQQIAVHKSVVHHLKYIKNEINNKIKELK